MFLIKENTCRGHWKGANSKKWCNVDPSHEKWTNFPKSFYVYMPTPKNQVWALWHNSRSAEISELSLPLLLVWLALTPVLSTSLFAAEDSFLIDPEETCRFHNSSSSEVEIYQWNNNKE